MGIKDLYPVIKEVAPNQIASYHLSELTGYRLAIDISIFLYKYIRSAGPKRWMSTFILLLCTLKKHGIKAVCIFDGPNPPIEKKGEQDRRRAENQKALNRLADAIRIRNKIQDDYIPFDKPLGVSLLRETEIIFCRTKVNLFDISDVVVSLNDLIEKLERQTFPITDDYRDTAISIVEMMGLHGIQAEGEAETLCAYLAVTGKVDAVLSEDTDVLAYGTPFMLAFKDYKLNDEKVYGIHLPSLLEEMEMNVEEFRDLCILLSCDYNSRVKGFPPDGRKRKKSVGIGAKGALCMIQEYRRLEEVCNHVDDPAPLKYRRCRELFTIPDSVPEDMIPYNLRPNYVRLEEFISHHNLTIKVDYIAKCYKWTEIIFDSSECSENISSECSDGEISEDEISFEEDFTNPFDVIERDKELVDEDDIRYVILVSKCKNCETGESKVLEAHFKFMSSEIYEMHDSGLFTELIKPFEEWLSANGHNGWYTNNIIEPEKEISESDAIMPYTIGK